MQKTIYNSQTLSDDNVCGCYYCFYVFSKEEIKEIIGYELVCPACTNSTVISFKKKTGLEYFNLLSLAEAEGNLFEESDLEFDVEF